MTHDVSWLALVLVLVAACSTPVRYSQQPYVAADPDTEYAVDERSGGFTLSVYYSRYQFFPSPAVIETTCRRAAMSLAHDVAEKRGRKLQPINEQRIRVDTGRNGFTGVSSCTASVPVEYAP